MTNPRCSDVLFAPTGDTLDNLPESGCGLVLLVEWLVVAIIPILCVIFDLR